jgi:hypothetical protein
LDKTSKAIHEAKCLKKWFPTKLKKFLLRGAFPVILHGVALITLSLIYQTHEKINNN